MEEVVKAKYGRYTQPFLLSMGNIQNPEHYFIVVDRIAIPCGQDIVKALDMLFKSHYVFNVEYATLLNNFWEFIAAMIYGVIEPSATGPTVPSSWLFMQGLKFVTIKFFYEYVLVIPL